MADEQKPKEKKKSKTPEAAGAAAAPAPPPAPVAEPAPKPHRVSTKVPKLQKKNNPHLPRKVKKAQKKAGLASNPAS